MGKPKPPDQSDLFGAVPAASTLPLPYNGEPPFQRHSEPSIEAAHRIKVKVGPLHRRIIDFLERNPTGATDEQMQDRLGMGANTQRPRRRELELMGIVVNSGRKWPTRSGIEATVWILKRFA